MTAQHIVRLTLAVSLTLAFAFGASTYRAEPSTAAARGAATQMSDQQLAATLLPLKGDFPKYYSSIIPNPCRFVAQTRGIVTARATLRWGGPNSAVWAVASVFKTKVGAERFYQRTVSRMSSCATRVVERLQLHSPLVLRSFSYGRLGDASRAWRLQFSYERCMASGGPTTCTRRRHPGDLVTVRVARAVVYYLFFNLFPDVHGNDFGQTDRNKAIVHRAVARAVLK